MFCSIGRLISTGMLNAARPGLTFRTADTRGALPRRCWLRFFVVLLPVPDLLLLAKHLFSAGRVAPRTGEPLTIERDGRSVGFDSCHAQPYFAGMPPRRRTSKDTPRKLAGRMKRRWRVVLLRHKGEILGEVEAPDAEAAKAAAAVQFELDDIQRNRIMVQELA